ncbi:NADH-quinone oxidoreductase subunit NuoH [Fundidesulfovibrio soli]|uniref:NADH-quinone oxidoreductase subunit NuoH n=1 Tax=Fundidesulfovibrio soli TaxID=2922716 RepID=UPI001FB03C5F|nr:NADH-quinone oxidoreductase subunit NuoH [Fundidesulfovibrio soli]
MNMLLGVAVMLGKMALVLGVVLTAAAYLVLLERKLLGRMQLRYGPNRVGFFGLLQPLADTVKMLLKEDTVPEGADRFVYLAAPALAAAPVLLSFAVVPFGEPLVLFGRSIPLVVTDLNVGLLFVLAMSSLGVYGVALAGWASDNKYSLLGGIRAAAQMVSYEIPLALSLVPVVMLARSLNLSEIVAAQDKCWFLFMQPVSFALFLLSAMAESRRIPFDLPEAENELMAGFHTEYSGMRFGLFFLGEYMNMILLGLLVSIFFLGGWRGPLLPPLVWLGLKTFLVPVFLIWTRASLPRLRYDQLMALGWKVLIPVALANALVTGAVLVLWP